MSNEILRMLSAYSGIPPALRMLKVSRRKRTSDKIKIVFLCQLSHVWGCLESVYEAAKQDENCEVYIVAVPNVWERDKADTEAYDFCVEKGYEVIKAYNEKTKQFFDLKTLNPDYVFIPRPYDHYLPKAYTSKEVSKYAKVCYICYGYTAEDGHVLISCYNRYFTSNCYYVFADNASTYAYTLKNHPISTRLGIRKIVQTTFPRFDLLKKWENCEPRHWKISKEDVNKRIIWTPRWTTDKSLGGTSFFTYKDFFFQFAKEHSNTEIMVRPHPLAFPNFIKEGSMTEEEVAEYKVRCKEACNLQLDDRKEYLDSFASADILVSDMSAVVLDFLAMGKPIVFCSYEQELNSANKKLIEGFYVSRNQEDLKQILEMLMSGEDPKKELREAITKEVLGNCDGKAGLAIVRMLKEDAGFGKRGNYEDE